MPTSEGLSCAIEFIDYHSRRCKKAFLKFDYPVEEFADAYLHTDAASSPHLFLRPDGHFCVAQATGAVNSGRSSGRVSAPAGSYRRFSCFCRSASAKTAAIGPLGAH